MKLIIVLFASLLLFLPAFPQDGWRKAEMEIRLHLNSQEQADTFRSLDFNAETASPDGSILYAYVTPPELEILKQKGFQYEINIADLNAHYNGFWKSAPAAAFMSYQQIQNLADSLEQTYPSICKKVTFGTSVSGRLLAALKISDNVNISEPEPGILFDGGIHGDEIMGPELVIRYARALCTGYGINDKYTELIDNREIWLYYLVNPDGFVNMSRYNSNIVDCNRDAGYMWNGEGGSPSAFSQPESKALRDCMVMVNPVVYTNYHGGTEIISYAWSYRASAPPDWQNMEQLAGIYSDSSGYANLPYGQGYNIMYPINGSNKDFQYGTMGNVGWSIEITVDKQPSAALIGSFYSKNEPAMTEIIERSGYGVHGIITDSVTGDPVRAKIWISNLYPVSTRPEPGDYHKYLLPGTYSMKVTANGYKTIHIQSFEVPSEGSATIDLALSRDTGYYASNIVSSRIPLSSFSAFTDNAYTAAAIGRPDSLFYSLWKDGWIILDMGDTIFNSPGKDLRVVEGGPDPEGYSCYAGIGPEGPWKLLGSKYGTEDFDLDNAFGGPMEKARYLKITDDGDGPTTGNHLGFDLDAVEFITIPLKAMFTASDVRPLTDEPVHFTDQTAGTPVSWLWDFPGGTPSSSTEQNPVVTYTEEGIYDVKLTVTNDYCSSVKTKTGYITAVLPSGIAGKEDPLLNIFPNPAHDYFMIHNNTTEDVHILILSSEGKKIMEKILSPMDEKLISTSTLEKGIYIIEAISKKRTEIRKIIIE